MAAERVKTGARLRPGGLLESLGCRSEVLMLNGLEAGFIYFPQREYAARPEDFGLRADTLSLESAGGVRLQGWWIHGDGRTALLFFHGNGGNISHRLERAKLLVESLGLDIFLVDYRGYGASGGKPDENGLYADAEAVHRAATERGFRPDRIVLFGESLGCAVAIETALRHPCRAVILETPFLSIAAMAKAIYPILPRFVIRTRFDNEAKISRVTAPKLIVAAGRDDVVPPGHARRLFELASEPREFYEIPGATHNDTYVAGGRAYVEVWRRFLSPAQVPPSP
jgi:fermentation-respiration switch protein FrsA (DUF1100 family)